MVLNGISIADPAKSNQRLNINRHYKEELHDPKIMQHPEFSEATKRMRFPVVGNETIPYTNQEMIDYEEYLASRYKNKVAKVDVFVEKSTLTLDQAKAYILKNHYYTPFTSINSWREPNGRVRLFERRFTRNFA